MKAVVKREMNKSPGGADTLPPGEEWKHINLIDLQGAEAVKDKKIVNALSKSQLQDFLETNGVKRAKVIEKNRYLEVRAKEQDFKVIKEFLSNYSIQFDFEVKKIKPWEARFKKIVFIKKWEF